MTREKRVAIVAGIIVVTAVASLFSHQAVIFRIRKMRKRGFWRLFYSDPSVVQDGAGNAGRCTSHGRLIGGLCCAPTQGPTAANAWIGKGLAAVAQDWPALAPNAGLAAGIGLAAGVAPAPAAAFSVICAAAPQPVACPASTSGYVVVTGGQIVVTGGSYPGTYPATPGQYLSATNNYFNTNTEGSAVGLLMELRCGGKIWGTETDQYSIIITTPTFIQQANNTSVIYSETIPNYNGEPTGTLKFKTTDATGGAWVGTFTVAWQSTAP